MVGRDAEQPWSSDADNSGTISLQQRKTSGERQFILSSTFPCKEKARRSGSVCLPPRAAGSEP